MLHSWRALDPVPLREAGEVTAGFLRLSISDFQSAAKHLASLPYGRNREASSTLAVLTESRGTCSTKHALLRRLAIEQRLDVTLWVGVYEMTAANTPGVARILQNYGLERLPEAHCYLRRGETRIDLTFADVPPLIGSDTFLYEEQIAPEQIGEYKKNLHFKFLERWATQRSAKQYPADKLWQIREQCIDALSQENSGPTQSSPDLS